MNKSILWLQTTNNDKMNKYDEMVVRIIIFCREPLNLVYWEMAKMKPFSFWAAENLGQSPVIGLSNAYTYGSLLLI